MEATTEEKKSRVLELLDSQRRVLERIASGAPLEDILVTLVRLIEEQARDMRCTVLLADAAQQRLHFAAAPSFSDDFRKSMQPFLFFGPEAAPCGAAAYYKRPVYIRDIAADSHWASYREPTLRNGVRAIWSTPILADDNRVLGTFAMYYGEPRLPDAEHIRLIDMAVQMARVAIEARADDDLLQISFDQSSHAIAIANMEGRIVRANHAFARQLGYAAGDLRGRPVAELVDGDDEATVVRELLADGSEIARTRRYRKRDGSTLWARERWSARRGLDGEPRYIFMHVEALGEKDPLAALSGREREVFERVVAGRTSKDIATELGIAPASVDTYRSRIMLKLGIDDLPGLVRFAIRRGIASA